MGLGPLRPDGEFSNKEERVHDHGQSFDFREATPPNTKELDHPVSAVVLCQALDKMLLRKEGVTLDTHLSPFKKVKNTFYHIKWIMRYHNDIDLDLKEEKKLIEILETLQNELKRAFDEKDKSEEHYEHYMELISVYWLFLKAEGVDVEVDPKTGEMLGDGETCAIFMELVKQFLSHSIEETLKSIEHFRKDLK